MSNEKTVYEAPAMTSLGSFETLTQGGASGTRLDATFPTGTPFSDLTFS
nr:lasso RiPP family leader peptide-containing protein [uncultured Brevundimonas sp.]